MTKPKAQPRANTIPQKKISVSTPTGFAPSTDAQGDIQGIDWSAEVQALSEKTFHSVDEAIDYVARRVVSRLQLRSGDQSTEETTDFVKELLKNNETLEALVMQHCIIKSQV